MNGYRAFHCSTTSQNDIFSDAFSSRARRKWYVSASLRARLNDLYGRGSTTCLVAAERSEAALVNG